MRRAVLPLLLVAIALVATTPAVDADLIRPGQAAPEITGESWINSERLSLKDLRGRVVFVEFWTYG